jgi:hypothetical protein
MAVIYKQCWAFPELMSTRDVPERIAPGCQPRRFPRSAGTLGREQRPGSDAETVAVILISRIG